MIKSLELSVISIRSANTMRALRKAVAKTELTLLTELKEFEQSQLVAMALDPNKKKGH